MAAFAKKQLEKWGWKEGEGLGRNKDGMNNYIKTSKHNRATHNRDEKGNTYAGIGHESSRGAGAGFAERNQQLESVFAELVQQRKANKKNRRGDDQNNADSSSSDDAEEEVDAAKELKEAEERRVKAKEEKMKAQRRQRSASAKDNNDNDSEDGDRKKSKKSSEQPKPRNSAERARSASKSPVLKPQQPQQSKKKTKAAPSNSPSSSSSSSSDSDSDAGGDITKMSDAELFARCGGVRLGRAGRHRLFDNKLKRIQEFENATQNQLDPYEQARQAKKKI